MLSLSFETLVGNRIHVEGLLTTSTACLTSGGISCEGVADFSNTFDADVASMIPGVQFSNLTPGVFEPVPEPASAVLMAPGLWALLQRRKRI